ncbi:MAG TPA: biopolymer transporter ExbD [Coleofasciculaceae cyanobacterium]
MKLRSDIPAEDVQIQIIPLIDVIFCILTFFILAALQLTRQQAINLDLPKASTGTTQMRDMLVVSISSTGQTFVDRQPVDRAQLKQALETYHNANPSGLLVLYASQTAFYNDVVQVLDLLRQVGGNRVALATLPADSNASSAPGLNSPMVNPTTVPTFDPYNFLNSPSPGVNGVPSQLPGGLPEVSPTAPTPQGSPKLP